jgi:hypothetical protein
MTAFSLVGGRFDQGQDRWPQAAKHVTMEDDNAPYGIDLELALIDVSQMSQQFE